ncbi:MAG: hypothetical protein KJ630_24755 [Proteobacteria bacterium]|nr:hypothetical protein [Pseudomonadota bacterium]
MSELLTIKVGAEYVRFATEGFECCQLNKASVFPLAQAQEAKLQCRKLVETGVAAVLIKLTIDEEPFVE